MTQPARSAEAPPAMAATSLLRPAEGLRLLGEYQGSGFTDPRFLVRRDDGQVIQLSRLLYLTTAAIVEGGATDGGWDAGRVAARVAEGFGREITADNVRYLVAGKLGPLGVVRTGDPGGEPPGPDGVPPAAPPRSNLLLVVKVRGVLLRPRAAGAVGWALAWLHHPVLVAVVLAGFGAFETWLFAGHGAIGPLLGVLDQPVLFLAVAGLTLASLLFHEFGHASACRYGGARPGAIGFGLYLVWPSLYTDVTDAYRLGRAGRLRTDLGGVYFNAIFILALFGGYAATGQPVFLAAAFLDNFQILQQLVPLVRMDGYFILGDLAGVPDLLGLLGPIMASLLPGGAARQAGARARGLRRGPRVMVTAWVLVAIPLLAAVAGYTLWHLPVLAVTTGRSFSNGLTSARAAFSAGHPAAGAAAILGAVLLVIPVAALAYLLARIITRGVAAVVRQGDRLLSRIPAPDFTGRLWPGTPARLATGGHRGTRRVRLTVALSILGALSVVAVAALAAAGLWTPGSSAPATTTASAVMVNRARAAAWVAQQVSPEVTVSCDPEMCGQVRKQGFPTARLMAVRPTASNPLHSGVVVATPVVRDQFGTRLASVYAPVVIAGFGSGADRVDVRAIAPDGAAALRSQLASQRDSLISAGEQLLRNKNIQASPAARASLLAGHVNSRLLATLSVLAAEMPVRLVAFDDAPPSASPDVPLRGAHIGGTSAAARSAILAFLQAQQPPYRPAVAAALGPFSGARSLVTLRFDASGLLDLGST